MTNTTNGWPGKPGVPLNPEKNDFHWLRTPDGELVPYNWRPEGECERGRWASAWIYDREDDWPPVECTYLGPCLTPDEATALQARVAELEGRCNVSHRQAACLQNRHQGNTHERLPAPRWKGRKMSDDPWLKYRVQAKAEEADLHRTITDDVRVAQQAAEITRLRALCARQSETISVSEMRHGRILVGLERRNARQRRALAKLYQRRHHRNALVRHLIDSLATARREGMEKAAQIGDRHIEIGEVLAETETDKRLADNIKMQVGAMKQVVGAIRAAAGEGK